MMHKKRVPQKYSRREFFVPLLASGLAIGNINLLGMADIRTGNTPPTRRFHACVSLQDWEANHDRPRILKNAGVTDIWMGAYFYGKWYRKPEELRKMAEFLENKGFNVHIINLPLGHPGDAIRMDENTDHLATPSNHWKNYCTSNGQLYSGTSIHAPAVEENRKAMIELQKSGFDAVFLDDDFRVARMPGHIGGCFCDDCRDEFLETYGYNNGHWKQLIESVENRKPDQVNSVAPQTATNGAAILPDQYQDIERRIHFIENRLDSLDQRLMAHSKQREEREGIVIELFKMLKDSLEKRADTLMKIHLSKQKG